MKNTGYEKKVFEYMHKRVPDKVLTHIFTCQRRIMSVVISFSGSGTDLELKKDGKTQSLRYYVYRSEYSIILDKIWEDIISGKKYNEDAVEPDRANVLQESNCGGCKCELQRS